MDPRQLLFSQESPTTSSPPLLPTSPNFGPSSPPLESDSLSSSDSLDFKAPLSPSKRKLLQQNVVFRNLINEHLQKRHEALSVTYNSDGKFNPELESRAGDRMRERNTTADEQDSGGSCLHHSEGVSALSTKPNRESHPSEGAFHLSGGKLPPRSASSE